MRSSERQRFLGIGTLVLPRSFGLGHWAFSLTLGLLCLLVAGGCREQIKTEYGQRRPPAAMESVNGTAVFSEMFEHAGHKVYSTRRLSPKIHQRADCIVWFPGDFSPPRPDTRAWLEDWLVAKPGRALIYVGRDFDAAVAYWRRIQPLAPKDQQAEVGNRLREAKVDFQTARSIIPKSEDAEWFTIQGKYQPRPVRALDGDPAWTRAVDPSKLEMELVSRLLPSENMEVLLESKGDMLVGRKTFDGSRLLVVTNGSFLLNFPLVNHEHRKMAGKLVEEAGPPEKTVIFLESGTGGPVISDEDPSGEMPTGMEIFQVFPTCWILLHFAAAGVIFCFWRWPIFGPARPLEAGSRSDFGKHVEALGELLQRTDDHAYASKQVVLYQQTTKGSET